MIHSGDIPHGFAKGGFTPPYVCGIVSVGWGEAHPSWHKLMTWIYPVICVECNPRFMVQTFPMDLRRVGFTPTFVARTADVDLSGHMSGMQSTIYGADIPHGFAKGGLHPTLR